MKSQFAAGEAPRAPKPLSSPARHALLVRLARVSAQLAERLSEDDAAAAVSAATDLEALTVALERAPLLSEPPDAETAAAYARGRAAREQLLQAEGGAATSEELGQLLGITRQAVDKRRKAGRLLALRARGDWLYPRWQVAQGQLLTGLERVLEALAALEADPWAMLIFFLNTDTETEGQTPLAALRAGQLEAALRAAGMYGEQGAR